MSETEAQKPLFSLLPHLRLRPGFLPLLSTLAALLILASRAEMDQSLLAERGISLTGIQTAYFILIPLLLLPLIFENRLRRLLQSLRLSWPLLLAAPFLVIILMSLLEPSQSARLFRFPFSLWAIILHAITMLIYVLLLTLPDTLPHRLIAAALLIAGIIIALLSLASLGEYMRLDVPDEPIVASIATNFAWNAQLSPSFLASPYGTPDPAWSRFFLPMGYWLRLLGDSSIKSLRAFPLLVGLITLLVFGLTLWRQKYLNTRQKIAALVTLLSLSAFVRGTHNLRMDVGLGLYGACALAGLLGFFSEHPSKRRWILLLSLSLFIGLESVPTLALMVGLGIGLALVIWFLRSPQKGQNWQFVALYAGVCATSVALYFLGQFLPDIADGYRRYQDFSDYYVNNAALSNLGLPLGQLIQQQLGSLLNYHLRFSLTLSPVEIVVVMLAFAGLWTSSRRADRWLLLAFGLSFLAVEAFLAPSYGYWIVFAPWIAYGAARNWQHKRLAAVLSFALIPALLAPPAFDMLTAIQEQPNTREIAEAAEVAALLPPEGTIMTESIFWFALHRDYNVYHWSSLGRYSRVHDSNRDEAIQVFDPVALIVWDGYESVVTWLDSLAQYEHNAEIMVGNNRYLIYLRPD